MNTTGMNDGKFWVAEKVERSWHTFSLPVIISFLQYLHRVWTATALLAVPQEKTLWFDVTMDETTDCRAKRFLLVRA